MRGRKSEKCRLHDIPEAAGQRGELPLNAVARKIEPLDLPFHALQEDALLAVGVLIGVDDIPAVAMDEAGDLRDQALLIGAGKEERRRRALSRHAGSLGATGNSVQRGTCSILESAGVPAFGGD